MVIYSKEKMLSLDIWLTFFGYSNKVTRNLKGFSDVNDSVDLPTEFIAMVALVLTSLLNP